jgi:hypothetical protein
MSLLVLLLVLLLLPSHSLLVKRCDDVGPCGEGSASFFG